MKIEKIFIFSTKREANIEKTAGDLSDSDVFGESHNPPFLNEEWLAFLNRTTREVLNKEMDTLRDSNMVRFSSSTDDFDKRN